MKKVIISIIILWFAGNSLALEGLENVAIHGFISQGYLITTENDYFFSDTKDGTFEFNEMGLNFGTDVTDSLRIGIQFLAKDLGVLGNDDVTIDYAMADYNYRDWLGLRVGKIKKPHGLYNQSRDVDAGRLSIFLPQCIYHEMYRDQTLAIKGLSLYGRVFEQLDYQAFYGVFEIGLDSGFSYVLQYMMRATPVSFDVDPVGGVSTLWNTPLEGLNLGGTYIAYKWIANTAEFGPVEFSGYQVIGSLEFTYNDFMLSAEYSRTPTDLFIQGMAKPYTQEGEFYYATAAYRLTKWFEFGGGYSVLYSDINNRDDAGSYLKDFSLSLRFDINSYWIFKLEGHRMDSLSSIISSNPSKDWYMYAAKMTFSF